MSATDFGIKNAVAIRTPATANLMIDSDDRNKNQWPSPFNYTLQENQSIMNGYFHRIGCTEAVMEWCEPNISPDLSNNMMKFYISSPTAQGYYSTIVPTGFFNISSLAGTLIEDLNAISTNSGSGASYTAGVGDGFINLNSAPAGVRTAILDTPLARKLDASISTVAGVSVTPVLVGECADIRPYRYLDIVSDSLGYNQKLKDNSTNGKPRNVLLRWYFDEDAPEPTDPLGFPLLQGYQPFCRRRIFNPPKQIRWDTAQPIGQINMKVYDENGDNIPAYTSTASRTVKSNYLLTLQLSEN